MTVFHVLFQFEHDQKRIKKANTALCLSVALLSPPTVWAMTQESTYRNQIKCTFAKYTVKMTDTESTDKRKISENSSRSETDINMEDIKLQNSKDGKQKKNL